MREAPARPFDFGELLDGSFALYRRNFSTLFGIGLLLQAPIVIYWLLVPLVVGPGEAGEVMTGVASILILPYSVFAAILAWAALTVGLWEGYAGGTPTIGTSLKAAFRRLIPIFFAVVIAWTLTLIGFILFIVPGLILLTMFFAVLPVMVVEEQGPFEALGRSQRLSKGGRLRILGALVIAYLITLLPIFAMSMLAGVGFGMAGGFSGDPFTAMESPWMTGISQAIASALSALTWPFFVGVTLLLYVDRRARTDALDLESAAASLQGLR